MFNPQTPYEVLQQHHDRVQSSLKSYEIRRETDDAHSAPPHRQALARLGNALVEIGTRLQASDVRRPSAPRLDRMGNV